MRSDITGLPGASKHHGEVLPPGQRAVDGFPRFGALLYRAPPLVPADPAIEITGGGVTPFALRLAELASVQSVELIADLHCVAGWSATNLRWNGFPFEHIYRELIEPAIPDHMAITHFAFAGLDGYRCGVAIEDALAENVLIAHSLNGRPLDPDHGAPLRLVSPTQYGYVSVKHLCRIELHTSEPHESVGHASALGDLLTLRVLFARHPRARVWHEERNGALPTWLVRPLYRLLTPPIRVLSVPRGRPGRAQRIRNDCLPARRLFRRDPERAG
jgi:DMSO/TMAO reductase YedYZ molybdopterin-dependent catalytic subunit